MSYLSQIIIHRHRSLTRCELATIGAMNGHWAEVDTIWKRNPRYCSNDSKGLMKPVAYGTITAVLAGLTQHGIVEKRRTANNRYEYRLKGLGK